MKLKKLSENKNTKKINTEKKNKAKHYTNK